MTLNKLPAHQRDVVVAALVPMLLRDLQIVEGEPHHAAGAHRLLKDNLASRDARRLQDTLVAWSLKRVLSGEAKPSRYVAAWGKWLEWTGTHW